jgi:predicted enzyme related to lactoylglutathione lyase
MEKTKSTKKAQIKKAPGKAVKKAPAKNVAKTKRTNIPNKVVHFDIPVNNMERAKKFYSDIFGWKIDPTGMQGDYHLATTVPTDEKGSPIVPGGINGGLFVRDNPKQSIGIAINVPDIDKALSTIAKNGGKIVYEKMPVGDMGYVAQFEDPEGNLLSLWEDIIK